MNKEKLKIVSIVIPVYRGELTLVQLFKEIKKALDTKYSYEVIFVYDCGPDQSWKVICELKKKFPDEIIAIPLARNFGQHNAIICGVVHASGDFIVTMDEDLQQHPKDIINLIKKQQESDYDVVYGTYLSRNIKHSLFRNITSNFLKKILRIAIPELHPDYSSFRLIRKDIAKQICKMRNSYTFIDGYLSWITSHIDSYCVQHYERYAGKSSYTLKKLIEHCINIFVTFSKLPIRFLFYISILTFTISTIISIYLLIRKLCYNDLLAGYTSVIVIIMFGVSFILMGLGVIGEYIYQINEKVTNKPNYIEKERRNK